MNDIEDLEAWDAHNPLLMKLPPEWSFLEWGRRIAYDPRRKWRKPYGTRRESHTRLIKHLVAPTERAITLAVSLQGMLIESLRERDPRVAANRKRIFEMAEMKGGDLGEELEKMPWFAEGAPGAVVRGPTAASKSHTVEAILRHIPQVIAHGPNEECGWTSLKQLGWLKVSLPDDANKRSLYLAIALEIDRVLDTNHSASFKGRMKNGPMLLEVLHLLTIYRCGILILEEAQTRNLGPAILGNEFIVTFMRIMNCGIPMLLVGNPVAFENVLNNSQDLRRFSWDGIHDFGPISSYDDPEWREDLVPSIWRWTIFDEPDEALEEGTDLCKLLYDRTGGSASFLSRYRRECLASALRRGASRVERCDMDEALYSPSYAPLHSLIDAYATQDVDKLAQFSDQPIAYLQALWAKEAAIRKARLSAIKTLERRGIAGVSDHEEEQVPVY